MNDDPTTGSATTATLRMPLAQARAGQQGLEQEVVRFRAGLARQNDRIIQLEGENATLRQDLGETRLVAALTDQNGLLRQQVAASQAENDQLRDVVRTPKRPAPAPPATVQSPAPSLPADTFGGEQHADGRCRQRLEGEAAVHSICSKASHAAGQVAATRTGREQLQTLTYRPLNAGPLTL